MSTPPFATREQRPTPRTDQVALEMPAGDSLGAIIMALQLARQLERELETVRDAHMANCLAADTLRTEIRALRDATASETLSPWEPTPEVPVFDELALAYEIERVWGEHGAHSEVYRMLLGRVSATLRSEAIGVVTSTGQIVWNPERGPGWENPGATIHVQPYEEVK